MTENHQAKKYHQLAPKCIRSSLSTAPSHIFFKIMVILFYMRIKTTGKLIQFNVLTFEFFHPYVDKA